MSEEAVAATSWMPTIDFKNIDWGNVDWVNLILNDVIIRGAMLAFIIVMIK